MSAATMRPCGPEPETRARSIPRSRGEPSRQGRDRGAADARRSVVALGRAHLAERIHVRVGKGCALPLIPVGGEGYPWRLRADSLSPLGRGGYKLIERFVPPHPVPLPSGERGRCGTARSAIARARNHRHHGADLGSLADLEADIGERAGDRRGYLHRGLVGLDLEKVVARLDGVAGRLEPLHDLAFGDGFAELRHQDVHSKPRFCRRPRASGDPYAVHSR